VHDELASKLFEQFKYPEPLSYITLEDLDHDYSNELKRIGFEGGPEGARLLAVYYGSVNDSAKVISLCQWALERCKDIAAQSPGPTVYDWAVQKAAQLRSLLSKHGGTELTQPTALD